MDSENKRTINQILVANEANYGDRIYLRQPRQGVWHDLTWNMVMEQARKVAAYLLQAGLKRGDRVAIFSKNCAEWFITDFGISLAGMVSVPLFANQTCESIRFVLKHAEVQLIFAGKLDHYQRVRAYLPPKIPTVSFGYHKGMNDCIPWSVVLETQALTDIVLPEPGELFTIIYSSGTTGMPKGAAYTHEAIASYLELFRQDIKRIRELNHYHLVSYLPLAHVYERSAIQLGSIAIPSDVSFIESLDKFVENLRFIQPTFFTAVPRIWGVFQKKIEARISPAQLKFLLKIPLISHLLKRKIRKQLGLNVCSNFFSGASHLPELISTFFEKLDIPIQVGYGQTENLAYATFSMLHERRRDYAGTPRLSVEIKLGNNDELLIKSPCLMKEYYNDPEASIRVLTLDGWLFTGDIAEIDSNNRVKICGRLAENFKNQKGEFIAPAPIEKLFANCDYIEQICLVGRELPNNILLITLNEQGKGESRAAIKATLKEDLHRINSQLASYEKISQVIIAKLPWTVENGLLTPTLKVKRRFIESHYQSLIQEVIKKHQTIVWE